MLPLDSLVTSPRIEPKTQKLAGELPCTSRDKVTVTEVPPDIGPLLGIIAVMDPESMYVKTKLSSV